MSRTRETGIGSHFLAAAICGIAWRRGRYCSRLALVLGLLEAFLCLDAVFNWRWLLHAFLMGMAQQRHVYEQRSLPQEIALSVVCAAAIAAVILGFRRFRNNAGAQLAIAGAAISVACWFAETISLHASDAILQSAEGPVMTVAVLWILSSAITAVGVLWMSAR